MRSIRDSATGELRDSLSRDWTRYLDNLDITVLPVPNTLTAPAEYLLSCSPDAVLLTNGDDVGSDQPRDQTERALVETATTEGIPVLGVCRGHQFLNTYYGGTLRELTEHMQHSTHAGTDHNVTVTDPPERATLPEELTVNSYHDMGIVPSGVASELTPFATASDGRVVEGLYHPSRPVLSIQWHPERPLPDRPPVDSLVTDFLTGELTW